MLRNTYYFQNYASIIYQGLVLAACMIQLSCAGMTMEAHCRQKGVGKSCLLVLPICELQAGFQALALLAVVN